MSRSRKPSVSAAFQESVRAPFTGSVSARSTMKVSVTIGTFGEYAGLGRVPYISIWAW
ncbi:hypothetical protein ACFXGI_35375 [Streptomyces sp. NPDC059355]|uniref:hypothetical protein n=1 Tax=Streptomyces sp. NPDC059355 TaxID=3346811 RepID=UPI00368EC56F